MDTLFDMAGGPAAQDGARQAERPCTRRCLMAHSKRKCQCACGGHNHGAGPRSGSVVEAETEQLALPLRGAAGA